MMGIFMSLLNLTKGHNKYIFLNIRNGKSMLNDENIISKSRSIIDLRNVNFTIQEFRFRYVDRDRISIVLSFLLNRLGLMKTKNSTIQSPDMERMVIRN